jgi:hypothetical protein
MVVAFLVDITLLTKRWGIFWRPVKVNFDKWTLLSTVCAKLHNICVDKNIPIVPRHWSNTREGDSNDVYLNIRHMEDSGAPVRVSHDEGRRRSDMTNALQNLGVLRPLHALRHSRE